VIWRYFKWDFSANAIPVDDGCHPPLLRRFPSPAVFHVVFGQSRHAKD
jgi:hypothetical protein